MRQIKNIFIKALALIIALLLIIPSQSPKALEDTESFSVTTDRDFRAVWVTPLVGDIPRYTSKTQYQKEILSVLETMEHFNFNILLFHVRIYNDALYESQYNNWSSYYNTNPDWDALPWIIEECHKRGIEFHAWMNPYRVATGSKSTNLANIAKKFPTSNPASRAENLIAGSGTIILNPGLPSVRSFLIKTCMEVVENYDVDAIHFDDYFYVEDIGDADASTYAMYNEGKKLEDWRRHQIDLFIEQLHNSLTKYNVENNRAVQLGISPTPIYDDGDGNVTYDENGTAITTGSKTSYGGHYDDYHFVDSKKWIDNEWIDYFVPQCYHGVSSPSEFIPAIDWWSKVVKYKTVNLYIGIGLYRAGSSQDWSDEKEFYNEMALIQNHPEIQGISIFSYKHLEYAYKDSSTIYYKQMKNANEFFKEKALPPIVKDTTNTVSGEEYFKVIKTNEGNKLIIKKQEGIKWYAIYRSKDSFTYDNTDYLALTGNNINGYIEYLDQGAAQDYTYSVVPLTYSNVSCKPLTATLSDDICKVTFKVEGEVAKVQYLSKGESAVAPELNVPGFTYTWDQNFTNVQNDLVVNATLSERLMVVTFLGPNGEVVKQVETKYNTTIERIKVEVEGYTFQNWNFDFKTPITEDIEITGKYKINTYKVRFYVNGNLIETITADYNTDVTPPHLIEIPAGYIFKGWDQDLTQIKKTMSVNAILVPAVKNIRFLVDGKLYHELDWNINDEVSLPEAPTKEGYTFIGWDQDFTTLTGDATVNAIFEINEYQVSFYDNDTLLGTEQVQYGQSATGFEPLGKDNHNFIGWDKPIDNIKSDLTVNAVYELNSYNLVIKDEQGNVQHESKINHGTNITKELIQELIGKEIKNFTVTTGDASNVTSDIEVTISLSSSGCNNASIIYFATFAILAMVISFIKRKSFK